MSELTPDERRAIDEQRRMERVLVGADPRQVPRHDFNRRRLLLFERGAGCVVTKRE